jgi:hypothetical protein
LTNATADTRSGYVAAKSAVIRAPSPPPESIAHSDPAASITARTSSILASIVGTSRARSDIPMPRLSKIMTREKSAIRVKYRASNGCSHIELRSPAQRRIST